MYAVFNTLIKTDEINLNMLQMYFARQNFLIQVLYKVQVYF